MDLNSVVEYFQYNIITTISCFPKTYRYCDLSYGWLYTFHFPLLLEYISILNNINLADVDIFILHFKVFSFSLHGTKSIERETFLIL